MRIDRFLSKNRILDLKSRELPLALDELLAVALPAGTTDEQKKDLRDALVEREAQMQRRVGDWAALPNIRTGLVQSTVIAVGRLPAVPAPEGENAAAKDVPAASALRVIFLVLAPEHGRNYHTVLSELVHELEGKEPVPVDFD